MCLIRDALCRVISRALVCSGSGQRWLSVAPWSPSAQDATRLYASKVTSNLMACYPERPCGPLSSFFESRSKPTIGKKSGASSISVEADWQPTSLERSSFQRGPCTAPSSCTRPRLTRARRRHGLCSECRGEAPSMGRHLAEAMACQQGSPPRGENQEPNMRGNHGQVSQHHSLLPPCALARRGQKDYCAHLLAQRRSRTASGESQLSWFWVW